MGSSEYIAVGCKVKALYGKRLSPEDFERLSSMRSVSEIASYLRSCPGWQSAMEKLADSDVHRGELEDALKTQVQEESSRIYSFMTSRSKRLLLFFIHRMDLNLILAALRRIQSGSDRGSEAIITDIYRKYSRINHEALDRASDFLSLLSAVQGSMFYEPLRALISSESSGMPDYTKASLALLGVYYVSMHKTVVSCTAGSEKALLLENLAGSVDLSNVVHVMRVKKYFPGSEKSVYSLLIPKFFRLKPSFFKALYESADMDSAFSLLRASPYGRLFSENHFEYIEQYQMLWNYTFDRKQLLSGTQTVFTPMAYISLKMHELHRLINIIECVRYGLPPGETPYLLI